MTDETILTNAVLVLPDATMHGKVVVRGVFEQFGRSKVCVGSAPVGPEIGR